jgi:hypothetical protein
MWAGPLPMRPRLGVILALALFGGPVMAEPASWPDLSAALEGLTGYRVTAPPSGPKTEWCVFDRAVLKAEGAPDLAADQLRLRGEIAEGTLVELAVEAGGVRLAPGFGQRDLDPILREMLRLQTAEVAFVAAVGPEGLALQDGRLKLSGGTELDVEAEVAGAGLSAGSLLMGRLTHATVDWRNDGKLLRPVMQASGEGLVDGALGESGIRAARLALQHMVLNLPDSLLQEDAKDRLDDVLDALPEGRGRMVLAFRSAEGIGAAQVGMAALSGDPFGPEAMARLFAGASVTLDWTPGLTP